MMSKIRFLAPLLGLLAAATVQGCGNSSGITTGTGGSLGSIGGSTGTGGGAGGGGGGTTSPKVTIIGSGS